MCPSEKLFSAQLPQYVYPFGSADMLTPFAHYKDLLDCGIEDLKKLFERLLTIGEYDSLVVEMGALSESLMEFMVCADRLFVVDKRDGFGDVRKKVFLHYCEMEKKNDLLALAEFIPEWEEIQNWRENLCTLPLVEWSQNNQLMSRMEHLLEKEGGPEDGFVWEDME